MDHSVSSLIVFTFIPSEPLTEEYTFDAVQPGFGAWLKEAN